MSIQNLGLGSTYMYSQYAGNNYSNMGYNNAGYNPYMNNISYNQNMYSPTASNTSLNTSNLASSLYANSPLAGLPYGESLFNAVLNSILSSPIFRNLIAGFTNQTNPTVPTTPTTPTVPTTPTTPDVPVDTTKPADPTTPGVPVDTAKPVDKVNVSPLQQQIQSSLSQVSVQLGELSGKLATETDPTELVKLHDQQKELTTRTKIYTAQLSIVENNPLPNQNNSLMKDEQDDSLVYNLNNIMQTRLNVAAALAQATTDEQKTYYQDYDKQLESQQKVMNAQLTFLRQHETSNPDPATNTLFKNPEEFMLEAQAKRYKTAILNLLSQYESTADPAAKTQIQAQANNISSQLLAAEQQLTSIRNTVKNQLDPFGSILQNPFNGQSNFGFNNIYGQNNSGLNNNYGMQNGYGTAFYNQNTMYSGGILNDGDLVSNQVDRLVTMINGGYF